MKLNQIFEKAKKNIHNLVRKEIINKRGKKQVVYVKPGKAKTEKNVKKQKVEKNQNKKIKSINGLPQSIYTPEFKNWFGDWEKNPDKASKIVDKKTGKPKVTKGTGKKNIVPAVLFHGSPKVFKEFSEDTIGDTTDSGYFGSGFYFTDNKETAVQYSGTINQLGTEVSEFIGAFDTLENKQSLSFLDTKNDVLKKVYSLLDIQDKQKEYNFLKIIRDNDETYRHNFSDFISEVRREFPVEKLFDLFGYDKNEEYDLHYILKDIASELDSEVEKKNLYNPEEHLYKCFLNIKNPFMIEHSDFKKTFNKLKSLGIEKFINEGEGRELYEQNMPSSGNYDAFDGIADFDVAEEKTQHSIQWDEFDKFSDFVIDGISSKVFTEFLKSKGHDGIIVKRNANIYGYNEYVAFEPNQIKHIDAKEFNPKSNNMYKSWEYVGVQGDSYTYRNTKTGKMRRVPRNIKGKQTGNVKVSDEYTRFKLGDKDVIVPSDTVSQKPAVAPVQESKPKYSNKQLKEYANKLLDKYGTGDNGKESGLSEEQKKNNFNIIHVKPVIKKLKKQKMKVQKELNDLHEYFNKISKQAKGLIEERKDTVNEMAQIKKEFDAETDNDEKSRLKAEFMDYKGDIEDLAADIADLVKEVNSIKSDLSEKKTKYDNVSAQLKEARGKLLKAMILEKARSANLVRKEIVNKRGKKQVVWVKPVKQKGLKKSGNRLRKKD